MEQHLPDGTANPEWLNLRAGKFTGSRFAQLMARTKSGPAAARRNLIATLVIERINEKCVETYQNAAMARGNELEPFARQAYQDSQFCVVDEVAWIPHSTLDFVGMSPDGLVGDDGMTEFKCPSAEGKHLAALLHGAHVKEYKWQLQGQLWVAERDWVDAVSYDPRWPEDLQLAIVRVERDEVAIKSLEADCIAANDEINETIKKLTEELAA